MLLFGVNIWAVIVATIAGFLFGWGWYSIFGKTWAKETGIDMKKACKDKKHNRRVYIGALLLSFIAAFVFARGLGDSTSVGYSAFIGLIIGTCWVSTSIGINYLFANRSMKLFLIDAGYHIAQFVIYGVVLGLWH